MMRNILISMCRDRTHSSDGAGYGPLVPEDYFTQDHNGQYSNFIKILSKELNI